MFIKILFWNVGCNVTAVFIIKDSHLYEVVLIAKEMTKVSLKIEKKSRLSTFLPTL